MSSDAKKITHDDLVELASEWLKRYFKCAVVVTEMASGAMEEPDAIGWTHWGDSYLAECKASRRDFLADKKKIWRKDTRHWRSALGRYRYYFAPKGLIKVEELPDGWGLAEVNPEGKVRCVKKIKEPTAKILDGKTEMILLVSCLRRIGQNCKRGVKVKCYQFDDADAGKEPRATLGFLRGDLTNDDLRQAVDESCCRTPELPRSGSPDEGLEQ